MVRKRCVIITMSATAACVMTQEPPLLLYKAYDPLLNKSKTLPVTAQNVPETRRQH